MQSDHDALFRAILASPDDDPLRLVFADWLEEFGDPQHAHFVRVQVANAELPPWDPAWIRANWIDRTTGYPNDFSVPYVRLPEGLSWQGGIYRRGFPSAAQTLMDSPLTRHVAQTTSITADFIKARMLRPRLGLPRELIGAAIFLASDAADLVTGHTLMCDGYLTA